MEIYTAPMIAADSRPSIRNSISMIRYGTRLFILNLIIPLVLVGIGIISFFTGNAPLPDTSNLKTVEVIYTEMEVVHQRGGDSYTITCSNGAQYDINKICGQAFDHQAFMQVMRGERLFISFDETEMPYSNGIQPIYSMSTINAVYLSADEALDAMQNNANLGKAMFPVMLGIAVLYLCLFLFAMTDAKKHYKLLKLFMNFKVEDSYQQLVIRQKAIWIVFNL